MSFCIYDIPVKSPIIFPLYLQLFIFNLLRPSGITISRLKRSPQLIRIRLGGKPYNERLFITQIESKNENEDRYVIIILDTILSNISLLVYSKRINIDQEPQYCLTNKFRLLHNLSQNNWHIYPIKSNNLIPFDNLDYNLIKNLRKQKLDSKKEDRDYLDMFNKVMQIQKEIFN